MTISPDAVETLALRAERPRAARLKSSSPDEIIEFRDAHGIYWRVRPDWFERLQSSANQSSQLPPATSSLPIAEWIAAPTTKVVKHGPHRTVYRIVIDGATVYLKHDRVLRWTDVVRRIFKASPSRREWFNSLTLARRGVSTIHPIAFGETIRSGVVRDSYFLSLEIPHSEQLDVYLIRSLERRGATEDAARRRELIVALAELCVRCHEAGVDHQDFHSGNILIQTSADGSAPPRLFLIDLPAVAFRRP
ncbi:MAG TPA: lipopolysaccharide kinase InaA family protein, partial [Pirellulales bacterium]